MCGITGFVDFTHRLSSEEQTHVGEAMTASLRHRGPDDQGVWSDVPAGVVLGHRRLSILELSALGHQPMVSASGRFVMTYNGEIYNFEHLRSQLSDYAFRGRSDTEVILAALERWGLEATLTRLDGMFAFAVWDRDRRVLHLARDRFGEKPLYYGLVNGALLFSSEMRAFRHYPGFDLVVDREALADLMRYSCVPAPRSIAQGIGKLPPATYLTVSDRDDVAKAPRAYWEYAAVARAGLANPFRGSAADAISRLEEVLGDTVVSRTVADVPVGAFLSGGIDSSIVVALLRARGERAPHTFTIGFNEKEFDEAGDARRVAKHLGTEHTELYVSPEQARDVVPRLSTIYDEPFADPSAVPTFLVAELARRHVTVALSGDAGDELFGGYNRYTWAASLWQGLRVLPPALRESLGHVLRAANGDSALLAAVRHVVPHRLMRGIGDKLLKVGESVSSNSADELYSNLITTWKDTSFVLGSAGRSDANVSGQVSSIHDYVDRMMCADAVGYLPDDILVKVDRAAMSVSLETRVPFLAPRVAELAWSLPREMKLRDGTGKWILRELLARHVPRELFERPKMGFAVPLASWLRGPLRPWAEELLEERRLRDEGYFEPAAIRRKWDEHISGRRNWQFALWNVLVFQSWAQSASHEHRPD